jgi:hypothetical protein
VLGALLVSDVSQVIIADSLVETHSLINFADRGTVRPLRCSASMLLKVIAAIVGTSALLGTSDALYARSFAPIIIHALDAGAPSLASALREEETQAGPSKVAPGEAAESD